MKLLPSLLLCILLILFSVEGKDSNGRKPANDKETRASSCPNPGPSHPPPNSIHSLRPADIGLIAGIGDSATAAQAARATNLFGFLFEDRDLSFVTGGRNNGSLASILRHYNPDLDGVSHSRNIIKIGGGEPGLNVAVSGAVSGESGGQAMDLVRKVKFVDGWRDKWKIVSIQMGVNDLCRASCDDSVDSSPLAYRLNLLSAISILHQNLPRTLVLLMVPFNPSPLLDITGRPLLCRIHHGCKCLFGEKSAEKRDNVTRLQEDYRSQIELLARDPRYDSDDFVVEVIPTFQGVYPRMYKAGRLQPDIQFMAPDCLHFHASLHSAIGSGIWNNLVEPAGERSIFRIGDPLKCLTPERPFLSTRGNSVFE